LWVQALQGALIIMKQNYCYLNGKILPLSQAQINICDIGLLRGFSVFDFLRCFNGKPFLLKDHLIRFKNSARTLNLKIPLKDEVIKKIITQLLKKNNLENATVRIFLSGGKSEDGLNFDLKHPTFFIIVSPAPYYPETLFTEGAKLITYNHKREKHWAKTSNYLTLLSLKKEKAQAKAIEVLYLDGDQVLEGATSNFFIIKNKKLITAKDNILEGTRRKLILKLAKNNFSIELGPINIKELKTCDEAFICSTTRNIVPVVEIDNLKISDGRVGPITKELMKLINDKIKQDCY
jgi:branched-chain amino acid aminotransferase